MNRVNSLCFLFFICLWSGGEVRANDALSAAPDAIATLLKQLNYWQGQNNDYEEKLLLKKIAYIDDVHPIYLESLIIDSLKKGEFQQAKNNLMKYKQVNQTIGQEDSLEQLIDIYENQRTTLGEARILAKRRENVQALDKYNQLIDGQPIHRELALEYWDILMKTNPEKKLKIVNELEKLTLNFPGNTKYQLAYLKHKSVEQSDLLQHTLELESLLTNNIWKDEAQRLWQSLLEQTRVNEQTIHLFQRYLSYFPSDNYVKLPYENGLKQLKKQQHLAKIPEYQSKIKALELLESNGNLTQIKFHLAIAMQRFPNDAELLSASARVNLREGYHQQAISASEQCIQLASENIAQCRSLLQTARYWQKISEIKKHYKLNRFDEGKQLVNLLYAYKNEGVAHLVLDAEYYQLTKKYDQALQKYHDALMLDPENSMAWQGLFELKLIMLTDSQLHHWYTQLPVIAQQQLRPNMTAFKVTELRQQAADLRTLGYPKQAQDKLLAAYALAPNDIWLKYDLAKTYLATNDHTSFQRLYQIKPKSAEAKYAYALLLASQDRYQDASDLIRSTAPQKRTKAMQLSLQRFEFEVALSRVKNESDKEKRLILLKEMWSLSKHNPEQLDSIAANFAQYEYYDEAITSFLSLQQIAPNKRIDYQIALTSLYQKNKQLEQADLKLVNLMVSPSLSVEQQITVIELSLAQLAQYESTRLDEHWIQDKIAQLQAYSLTQPSVLEAHAALAGYLGDVEQQWLDYQTLVDAFPAEQKYKQQLLELTLSLDLQSIKPQYQASIKQQTHRYMADYPFDPIGYEVAHHLLTPQDKDTASPSLLLLAFQAALLEQKARTFDVEARNYQTEAALHAALPLDHNLSELITSIKQAKSIDKLNENVDYWVVNRLRRKILQENAQQNTNIELAYSNLRDKGTSGISDVKLNVWSLALNVPFEQKWLDEGFWYLRFEPTNIDAGLLDISQSSDYGSLRLCNLDCSATDSVQQENGYAIAFGLEMPRWRADIGTTPLGFIEQDLVGGVEVDGELSDFSWTISATKRPQTSSVLGYAGRQDPHSGLIWGAARIYNVGGSLSYDKGEGIGAWSLFDHALITGKQIKSNTRTRLMGGGYYSLMDEAWLTTDVGLNLFFWQFKRNLSHYTLGHAGYYSPQSYQAISFPMSFYGRYNQWSYKLDLSFSLSKSKTDDSDYYPLHDQYQKELEMISDDYHAGGTSNGTGFSVQAAVEYKLGSHWLLGSKFTLQKSEDYSPNGLMFYFRYHFGINYLPVPKPPKFITPYKDFY